MTKQAAFIFYGEGTGNVKQFFAADLAVARELAETSLSAKLIHEPTLEFVG